MIKKKARSACLRRPAWDCQRVPGSSATVYVWSRPGTRTARARRRRRRVCYHRVLPCQRLHHPQHTTDMNSGHEGANVHVVCRQCLCPPVSRLTARQSQTRLCPPPSSGGMGALLVLSPLLLLLLSTEWLDTNTQQHRASVVISMHVWYGMVWYGML